MYTNMRIKCEDMLSGRILRNVLVDVKNDSQVKCSLTKN